MSRADTTSATLRHLRARHAGRGGHRLHTRLGGARRALDLTAGAALGGGHGRAPWRAAAAADAGHRLHGHWGQMDAQALVSGATVDGNPEITEHLINGNTPREACQGRSSQRVHQFREFLTAYAVAFACSYGTRIGTPGQRTGTGRHTQGRVGVRA
ncbi:hypothetical protein GCM10017784_35470 [Deinococcus indicus]|nr:hypothetical protein GCM10017784_35470 [Deinococcus indicus]